MPLRHARPLTVLALLAASAASLAGQSTISPTGRYAYAANLGWIDARPSSTDGVRLTDNVLSGWLYSANTGWISLGDGTPANGIAYANDSATDYGVNVAPSGALTGQAWSPTLGWLTFEALYGKPAVARSSGAFTGYVWIPNAGWITLGGFPSALVSATRAEGLDSDVDGLPDYWEIQQFGSITAAAGSDTNPFTGQTYRAEYLAASGPYNFGGYTWHGGYIGAPTDINVIQNWSPVVPPATFTGFTSADTLTVDAPNATVDAPNTTTYARELRFDSTGGQLNLGSAGIDTAEGLNLRKGTMNINGSVEITGPTTTSPGTTTQVIGGAAHFSRGAVTNAGTWLLNDRLYAARFINQGSFQLPNPARVGYIYGHFEGSAGSSVSINSARVAPGETGFGSGEANGVFGSLDWTGGGDLDIGTRSWTFVALQDSTPADASTLNQTNRFRLGGVDVTLATDAYFAVQSGWLTLYDKVAPQVELSDLTVTNAGTFRFQVDEIALRNLAVTGNPLEIYGQNSRTTRIRELSQAANAPGTLRADVFRGAFALEQPTLNNAIELTLGRAASETFVAVPDFVNNATLRIAGYATRLTPPVADTPASPLRTLTNNGTLAFGAGTSSVSQIVVNTGNLTVATGANVALDRTLDNRADVTIAAGGNLVSGPPAPPLMDVQWRTSRVENQGKFTFRNTRLSIAAVDQSTYSNIFVGNPVTLDSSQLRLSYGALQAAVTNFAFTGANTVSSDAPLVALFAGSFWRVDPSSTLGFSALVNAGTIELAGTDFATYPTAILQPTGELTNTGIVRTAGFGGILEGLLVNYGQIKVAADSNLYVRTPPHEEGTPALPGRIINYAGGSVQVAVGGTLRIASGGYAPVPVFELAGGTVANDGAFLLDPFSRFRFTGGQITGNPIIGINAALEIGGGVGNGSFVLRGNLNALNPLNALLPAGLSLRLEGDSFGSALYASSGFTNRGTLTLSSISAEQGISYGAQLQIVGTKLLVNDTGGTLRLAASPGLNSYRDLALDYRGPGSLVLDPGVQAYVTGTTRDWLIEGPVQIGAGATLTFSSADNTFQVSSTGIVRGGGQLAVNTPTLPIHGTLEPVGTLQIDAPVVLDGRLTSLLRASGADRVASVLTVNHTGAAVHLGAEQGITPTPGTRYVVLSAAGGLTGTLPTLVLDAPLAGLYTGTLDRTGNTLGVTLATAAARTFPTWAASQNLAGAAANSDADGDGLPLLLEYAFGLDPTRTDRSPLALTSQTSPVGALVLTFPWHRGALDYTWRAETSTTLATGSWTTAASVTTVITPNADPALATVTLTIPVTGPRNFARLVVTPGTPPLN